MSKQQTEAQYLVQWMEDDPCNGDERVIAELKRLEFVNDDLLDALQSLVACINETRGVYADNALEKARAAIAKATGETK